MSTVCKWGSLQVHVCVYKWRCVCTLVCMCVCVCVRGFVLMHEGACACTACLHTRPIIHALWHCEWGCRFVSVKVNK